MKEKRGQNGSGIERQLEDILGHILTQARRQNDRYVLSTEDIGPSVRQIVETSVSVQRRESAQFDFGLTEIVRDSVKRTIHENLMEEVPS
jgi:phage baseplate assembly protein W